MSNPEAKILVLEAQVKKLKKEIRRLNQLIEIYQQNCSEFQSEIVALQDARETLGDGYTGSELEKYCYSLELENSMLLQQLESYEAEMDSYPFRQQ